MNHQGEESILSVKKCCMEVCEDVAQSLNDKQACSSSQPSSCASNNSTCACTCSCATSCSEGVACSCQHKNCGDDFGCQAVADSCTANADRNSRHINASIEHVTVSSSVPTKSEFTDDSRLDASSNNTGIEILCKQDLKRLHQTSNATKCASQKLNSHVVYATERVGGGHEQSCDEPVIISCLSNRSDEDDLLAELESEFAIDPAGTGSQVIDDAADSCIVDERGSNMQLLLRRQKALECRLDSLLEAKKQLENDNTHLELKLQAASMSLIEALQNNESLKAEFELQLNLRLQEFSELKHCLKQQEENSQHELNELRTEYQAKIDQLARAYDDQQHEKEGVVIRFAQAEQRNIEMTDRLQKAEAKIREWTKERDVALGKWKTLKEEKAKLSEQCDNKSSEITSLKKENDKLKESVSSADIKLKWHQNKLKTEQDTLKETKVKLEKTEKCLKEMAKDVQQLWEELRALYLVILNADANTAVQQVRMAECKTASADEVCLLMRKDMGTFSWKVKEVLEELRTYKDKVHCLEVERMSQADMLSTVRDNLQSQETSNYDLRDRLLKLEQAEILQLETQAKLTTALQHIEELEKANGDLTVEFNKMSEREADRLEYTSRLSEKNSQLQAENTRLELQVETLTHDLTSTTDELRLIQESFQKLQSELENTKMLSKETESNLESQLTLHQKTAETMKLRVDDLEDEIKTLKRRHANNIKDLLRQLQQARRHAENGAAIAGGSGSVSGGGTADCLSIGSLGSHGGSCGSLDTAGLASSLVESTVAAPLRVESPPSVNSLTMPNNCDGAPNVEEVQSLRRALSRKTEKIEFLKDHIDQLVEELHRKSNIIRGYIIRDEAGTLAPETSDRNKVELAKRGGIMASLYSTQTLDSGMTLSLSLEINNKLQAILEDTLLKNIKLKEGMDTLGKEIDWLMRENNRLKQQAGIDSTITTTMVKAEPALLVDVRDDS